ncbi:MAG: phosphoesterase, partial [Cyclobacteriaceae bacterium]|nr:phosphoesterase [Cyclobacteriaceae bacterium]
YNQNSILRTMELILGLPPMNQFDMAATPMTDCFTDKPDFTPYIVQPNQIPLDEMNPSLSSLNKTSKQYYYAKKSMEMPLDDIDKADEGLFNRVLWHAAKGYDVPYPELARADE